MTSLQLQLQLQPPSSLFSSLHTTINTFSPSKLTIKTSFHSKHSFFKLSCSSSFTPSSEPESSNSGSYSNDGPSPKKDTVKLAFENAKAYKKNMELMNKENKEQDSSGPPADDDGPKKEEEVPLSVKIAMEKVRKYKKNESVVDGGSGRESRKEDKAVSGLKRENGANFGKQKSDEKLNKKEDEKLNKKELVVSSIDFVGLDFADKKKTKGLPPGLLPLADPFPEGDTKEVEIIVGDTSKFGDPRGSERIQSPEDSSDTYKPKVSTWGVFPRPSNISKTFGGGKNIRPGDALETPEERAAKDARTRELVAAYKREIGLNVDPKLKAECDKALKDGDSLMDAGRLKEALSYYERIMEKMPFKSELHGLAALQWSICQDSLTRRSEARSMYEKLKSHPNAKVSKRATQFMFSFQAMEMMKIGSLRIPTMNTGYQEYFEAFIEDKSTLSSDKDGIAEGALGQSFPYILLLISPIFIVLLAAIQSAR